MLSFSENGEYINSFLNSNYPLLGYCQMACMSGKSAVEADTHAIASLCLTDSKKDNYSLVNCFTYSNFFRNEQHDISRNVYLYFVQ